MVIIGSLLTLQSIVPFSLGEFSMPMILIGLGLYVIFKPKDDHRFGADHFKKEKLNFDQSSPEAK